MHVAAHGGPVACVAVLVSFIFHSSMIHFIPQRSPFFPDIILTAGGFSIHLWKEGIQVCAFGPFSPRFDDHPHPHPHPHPTPTRQTPLMSATVKSARITSGCWSQSRHAVFYIARDDGHIDAWDLLDRSLTVYD